jgi:hypothetical protein
MRHIRTLAHDTQPLTIEGDSQMSTKKSSTKKTTTRKQTTTKTRQQLRAELARNIAAIMANPETPAILYNDLADSITEMSSDLKDDFWHSPEQIERSINAHLATEAKRTGKGGVK